MDDIIYIQLRSVTIFWEDLGLPKRRAMDTKLETKMAEFWDKELEPWLLSNAKGKVNPHEAGVWFEEPDDAMLFKLTWAGNIEV